MNKRKLSTIEYFAQFPEFHLTETTFLLKK